MMFNNSDNNNNQNNHQNNKMKMILLENIISNFIMNKEMYPNMTTQLLQQWGGGVKSQKNYKWNIKFKYCNTSPNIIFYIEETFRKMPTSGGSSFTILQTSAHTKDFCPINDLFNGTYIAKCLISEDNSIIKGKVLFINFTAFTQRVYPFKDVIFEHSFNRSVEIPKQLKAGNHLSSAFQFQNGMFHLYTLDIRFTHFFSLLV